MAWPVIRHIRNRSSLEKLQQTFQGGGGGGF